MDIKKKQICSDEQAKVLSALAESAGRQNCKFLEIGSWCGDSTVLLGKIAKKYGGHLYCVDWWKGNVGTELDEIASKVDIYAVFWEHICKEGFEDVVVPIRARSDIAAEILKENTFDFIFIDGDHRYEAVMQDIKLYAPLVRKDGGILCGHDCEGKISDYNMKFLEAGRDIDYYETVHCGVVLAVGETFEDYSINYSIWSVRYIINKWEPTNLTFIGIVDKRQAPPPPFGYSSNYLLLRYGRLVYAVPRFMTDFDVTEEKDRSCPEVTVVETSQEMEKQISEKITYGHPELLESYRGFNIVVFGERIYALSMNLGHLDVSALDMRDLKGYMEKGNCVIGNSLEEVKQLVEPLAPGTPELVEEGYKGFNIVNYRGKFYAFAQALGPVDFAQSGEDKLGGYKEMGMCFIASSIAGAKGLVDKKIDAWGAFYKGLELVRKIRLWIKLR